MFAPSCDCSRLSTVLLPAHLFAKLWQARWHRLPVGAVGSIFSQVASRQSRCSSALGAVTKPCLQRGFSLQVLHQGDFSCEERSAGIGVRASNASRQSSPFHKPPCIADACLSRSLRMLAAVQVEASLLKERADDLASPLTMRATHGASAVPQVQQGKQAGSTAGSAIVKGCGPYLWQTGGAGASTWIKADRSGQAAGQWGDTPTEAMPLLRAASGASSVGRRDSTDSLRRSSTSSGSSRSSLELTVLVNAPLGPTFNDAGSAGWLGSRGASLAASVAHPRGGSGQLLQFPSAAALLSSSAAVHRSHGAEASPGGGSPAGVSGDAAAGQSALTVRSSGPGSSPSQVRCLCAAGPSAAVEPHCATGRPP